MQRQSIAACKPKLADLNRAFQDLVLDSEVLFQLAEAIHAGRGLVLYGPPGNGKTSIGERISRVFGEGIWIPRAIAAWGEVIRLYDPNSHEAIEPPASSEPFDRRWVYVRRPTVIAGGELTLDALDVTNNPATGVSEAPLQLKSNGGVLVIDDFGRQRVSIAELLNRWIIPLEKKTDYINLVSGRKVQVPFDQLLVFSTNLQPKDLVDEAFLRRIPYKIQTPDPTESQFRELFLQTAQAMSIGCDESQVNYLIQTHYAAAGRPARFCHARDLLEHVKHHCGVRDLPLAVSEKSLDAAVRSYFTE
jgi:predicted ATPase with chaperone activity